MLWLSPVYPSPQDDNGYDISDYQDIDPVFGTLADFDALLAGVHERGMKLVMDLVVNHTSDEHPWFVGVARRPATPRSATGTGGARPRGDGGRRARRRADQLGARSSPARPGSSTRRRGEYYLHLFSRKQPDLNWENPEVREAVYAMMRWWLDRGVDGFRMDVINLISKDPALPDGTSPGGSTVGDGSPYFIGGPRIHEFLQEMHREVFAGRASALLTVGEMPGVTVEEARLFTDPARGEVDMVFQFEHVSLDQGATQVGRAPAAAARPQGIARPLAGRARRRRLEQPLLEQPRPAAGRLALRRRRRAPGAQSAKMLGTVLHLHRGTPYVYQGEELGMTNAPFDGIEDFRDIESLNHYARGGRRRRATPRTCSPALRHDGPRQRAHADAVGRLAARRLHAPARRGSPSTRTTPRSTPRPRVADPDSVFHHYRRLIALRHDEPVVAHGDFTMLLPDDERVYAFTRRLGDVELLVLGNFSGEATTVDAAQLPGWDGTEVLVTTVCGEPSGRDVGCLEPWEARVHRRRATDRPA